jgi:hypothetical protein
MLAWLPQTLGSSDRRNLHSGAGMWDLPKPSRNATARWLCKLHLIYRRLGEPTAIEHVIDLAL